jgi:serine/threonine protein kinase
MLKDQLKALNMSKRPEEIFGIIKEGEVDERLAEVKHVYRSLVMAYHPDIQLEDDKSAATEILKILNIFYSEAKDRIKKEIYGEAETGFKGESTATIITSNNEYRVYDNISDSDYSNTYTAEYDSPKGIEKVIIKIANEQPKFLKNEIKVLTSLDHFLLPTLVETFKYDDGSPSIVYKYEEAYNLLEILEKYPNGVKPYHACWIMHRLLDVTGYLQTKDILNTNIQPSNILITPSNHKATLIDFKYAINYKRGLVYNCVHDYSSPEVRNNFKTSHPGIDIYSIGKIGLFLLGGKEKPYRYPANVHKKIREFVELLMKYDPDLRPYDSWKMWHELEIVRTHVFGEHEFLTFEM